jgi:hypothetical protein
MTGGASRSGAGITDAPRRRLAVTLAVVLIVRSGAPPEESPDQISAARHQHLVAAT